MVKMDLFGRKKIKVLEEEVETLKKEVETMNQAIKTHVHEEQTGKVYSLYE